MSRIGNRKLIIPDGVKVEIVENTITVTGQKGTLSYTFDSRITVKQEENLIVCTRDNDSKTSKSLHGTTNSLIQNMLIGVSEGYSKGLEITGVGYRFKVSGNKIDLTAGFSHPVIIDIPSDLAVEQKSNTEIWINGIDKQKVSEFAANVRSWRKPEPYKGKGIHYVGEHIRRKEGKKASK